MARDSATHPGCPRCGYDLSGAIDTWPERCPLEGICPECGLHHRWRDVLNPSFAIPKWFVENPNTRFWFGWVSTSLRCFRPRLFWREIWMTHPFVAWRLDLFACLWIIMIFLTLHGLAAAFIGRSPLLGDSYSAWEALDPISRVGVAYEKSSAWMWVAILWALLTPAGMLALTHTRRLARVRKQHLLRAGGYSIPLVAVLVLANVGLRVLSFNRLPPGNYGWWNPPGVPAWEVAVWDLFEFAEGLAAIALCGVILAWYWTAVTRRYMRLSQPRATAAIMLTLSGLASLAIVEWLSGKAIFMDLMFRLSGAGVRL